MGLLDGKRALVFGVANDHSIAWAIAKALHEHGAAEIGFSSIDVLLERRVRPLAESLGAEFIEPCDVRKDADVARVFDAWAARHPGADGTGAGTLDILVHALAFANREDLDGRFVDTSREGFALAMDVSAYSLVGIVREARRVLANPSSVMCLTYYGAEKVVQHYNVMGVAKAALEASTRYLAADLGPDGVRVNAISAGPVRTLAAAGISGFKHMHRAFREVAPLRTSIASEDVAGTAVWLASDLSRQVTGETIYVDGGFHILGVTTIEM
ncbi:MAG: enoyl-ACP reductase [Chloroflexi bacterium]|jgi:enoyl-[acyl-carrier protein] reductase I|nr:enoyl-ACP reductase [Chloroflexota bacterium]